MKSESKIHLKKNRQLILILIFNLMIIFSNISFNKLYTTLNVIQPLQSSSSFLLDLSRLPPVNRSRNSQWYDPPIEMLIITPNKTDFIDIATPLMNWKNEKGIRTIILSNFSLYEGRDTAERIRNMIKEYYERENIKWVLLAGDAQDDLIPTRYIFNPDAQRWGSTEDVGDDEYKPTDYYYADLTGTWDEDKDDKFGESSLDNKNSTDEISWIPEVYVGRLPASSPQELEIMINKTICYEKNPFIGEWMNRMLLIGGALSYNPPEYESNITNVIINNYTIYEMNYSHLFEPINLTQLNLINYFNNGYSTVFMAGHGSPTIYYRNPSNIGYTSSDAYMSTNKDMPSLIYLSACTTCPFDLEKFDDNLGEVLIKRENAGAIGIIGALRLSWYLENDTNLEMLNRGNAKLFWKEFFEYKKYQQGRVLYDSKLLYINSSYNVNRSGSLDLDFERKQLLTYCLLGDPELDIYTKIPLKVVNPFKASAFNECDNITLTIKDIYNNTISNARIHIESRDGKYHTLYSNKDGNINFTLPLQSSEIETYNVTITGHNLIPSHFNFKTHLVKHFHPAVANVSWRKNKISIFDRFHVDVHIQNNLLVLESVFLIISRNNFTNYFYYQKHKNLEDEDEIFTFNTDRMENGRYSFLLIARDYSNYLDILYETNYKLTVYLFSNYFIIILSLITIVSIIIFGYFSFRRLLRIFKYH